MLICDRASKQSRKLVCYLRHAYRFRPGQMIGALRSDVRVVEKGSESRVCHIACVNQIDQSIARCPAPGVLGNWSASPRQDIDETRWTQNREAYVAGRKMRLNLRMPVERM